MNFSLEVHSNNDALKTNEELADLLEQVAKRIRTHKNPPRDERNYTRVVNEAGHIIGSWRRRIIEPDIMGGSHKEAVDAAVAFVRECQKTCPGCGVDTQKHPLPVHFNGCTWVALCKALLKCEALK